MATLYISEFSGMMIGSTPIGYNTPAQYAGQMGAAPPVAQQTVAIGAGSVASSTFNAATTIVRLHTDAICSVAFGTAPVATAVQLRLAAGQTEYFGVRAGDKVAVIVNT